MKRQVWERDGEKCSVCGSKAKPHFDHITPYSKGGDSYNPKNIQILCSKHNLGKKNKIK
jgi:5-methylcytosine-specific restriction endonuclease McrA